MVSYFCSVSVEKSVYETYGVLLNKTTKFGTMNYYHPTKPHNNLQTITKYSSQKLKEIKNFKSTKEIHKLIFHVMKIISAASNVIYYYWMQLCKMSRSLTWALKLISFDE